MEAVYEYRLRSRRTGSKPHVKLAAQAVEAIEMTKLQNRQTLAFAHSCLLVFVVFALPAIVQASSPQNQPFDDYIIGVNVDMVVLQATALDHKGAQVSGLVKDNFQIY